MPFRIQKEHSDFIKAVSGHLRKELTKYIKTFSIGRVRANGGVIPVTLPYIDLPRIKYGPINKGFGRGEGDVGEIIGTDPNKRGRGAGNGAGGSGHAEGFDVLVDVKTVLKMIGEDLELPPMKPKPTPTFEEVRKRYTNQSRTGTASLLNKRATYRRALKRQILTGETKPVMLPGFLEPMPLITPIKDDFRYLQYNEYKIPSSNALIVFGRDGSGSMDDEKCEIVSDISYWIQLWISSFYKRTEKVHLWHDTECEEVDEQTFYSRRGGGGTRCSSCTMKLGEMIKDRYPVHMYNVYLFYFTDGDNWDGDNEKFVSSLQNDVGIDKINFVGITQVNCWQYEYSVAKAVNDAISAGKISKDLVRMAYVGGSKPGVPGGYGHGGMSEADRDAQVKDAIRTLLGSRRKAAA